MIEGRVRGGKGDMGDMMEGRVRVGAEWRYDGGEGKGWRGNGGMMEGRVRVRGGMEASRRGG